MAEKKIILYFCDMYKLILLSLLASCSLFPPKPSNEIEGLAEEVMKRKEGVDIRIEPIDERKKKINR